MTSQEPHEPLVFDRATAYYDRTRALPPEAMEQVVALLAEELGTGTECLEIGVGTGRMALPLARVGVSLVGLDLSLPMMRKLIQNAGGRAPFPLVHADARRSPFKNDAFDRALVVHVLHLIPTWAEVVDEVCRIVRAGGTVLVDQGQWATDDVGSAVDMRFTQEAGIPQEHRGANRREEVDTEFTSRGAEVRSLPEVTARWTRSLEERIQMLEDGLYSFTWSADEPTRREAAAAVRAWARDTYGSLAEPRTFELPIEFRSYTLS